MRAALRAGRVLHQVGFVEGDHAVEIGFAPFGQLLEARPVAAEIRIESRRAGMYVVKKTPESAGIASLGLNLAFP